MTTYFVPPTTEEKVLLDRATGLTWTVSIGWTVIKTDGTYRLVRSPSQIELEAADAYYLGAHRYEITSTEVTDLTAAGYGAYITSPGDGSGYGQDGYGEGGYGQ